MKSIEEIQQIIRESHGTGVYYRFAPRTVITEGVKAVADAAECYWLVDVIWSYQPELRREEIAFQKWRIERTASELGNGPMAIVTCQDVRGEEHVRQEIEYTDFPLSDLTICASVNAPCVDDPEYATAETIIYLPSED